MKKFRTAKFLALSLSLVMVLAAAGCGGNNGGSSTTPPPASGGSSTPAPAPPGDGALDLNPLTVDQLIEGAKAEGQVVTNVIYKERGK